MKKIITSLFIFGLCFWSTQILQAQCNPDVIPPSITCPANITVSNDAASCSAVVNWPNPTVSDNCGTPIPPEATALFYRQSTASKDISGILTNAGFAVTSELNDSGGAVAGLINSQAWDLIVIEITGNSLTNNAVNAITNYVNNGGKVIFSYWDMDGSSGINPASGPALQPVFGVTSPITFTTSMPVSPWATAHPVFNNPNTVTGLAVGSNSSFSDKGDRVEPDANSTAIGGFTASPTTNEAAIVLSNGDNTIFHGFLSANLVAADYFALFENEVRFLYNGTITQTAGLPSGATYPLGVTVNSFLATDGGGNTSSCNFMVTVNDTEDPTAACQSISRNLNASGSVTITAADLDNGSTDNCGSVSFFTAKTTFDCSDTGVNNVSLSVNDDNGNSSFCNTTVIISDVTDPNAICPNTPPVVTIDANGNGTLAANVLAAGNSTDNCSTTETSPETIFTCADIGTQTVVLTVSDGTNSDTENCNVTVSDPNTNCCPFTNQIYVDIDATGNNDGTSWADAFTDLQVAMDARCGGVTEIWVAEGTYLPTEFPNPAAAGNPRRVSFHSTTDLQLYGGFDGTETMRSQRDFQQHVTILSGDIGAPDVHSDNALHVIMLYNLSSASTLDGFTIERGRANQNGDAYSFAGKLVAGGTVGGLDLRGTAMIVVNCIFQNNVGIQGSALFFDSNATAEVRNCTLQNNIGAETVLNNASTPIFTDCLFYNNENTLGIIRTQFGTPTTLINCTIYGNLHPTANTMIVNDNNGRAIIRNSIIWKPGAMNFSNGQNNRVENSLIKNSGGSGNWNSNFGMDDGNNLSEDPLFVDEATGDLQLSVCSPAIDAGNNSFNNKLTDLADNPRIFNNGTIDMGAYELQSAPDPIAPQITCPANITVNNDPGACMANVTYTTPLGTDNCPNSTTTQIQGIASGSDFPVGTTTNTFEVSDGNQTDQCSFTVTVNDTEPPVFTFCPTDITQGTDAGSCDAVVNYDMPTVTDNCVLGVQGMLATPFDAENGQRGVMFDITATNTLNITHFDANLYFGTTARYEIYYKAGTHVGSQNNAAAWTFVGGANNVTSLGNHVPTPLPIPVNVNIPAGETYGFYVTNTSGGGLNYTDHPTLGDPIASNDDLTVFSGRGKAYPFGQNFNWRNFNGIIHYGGDLTLTQTQGMPSGSSFAVGTNTQTFTATDGAGNTATCTFDITINDTENPVAVCPNTAPVVTLDANGNGTLAANALAAGNSTDNCTITSETSPETNFTCADIGTQTVILTAFDGTNSGTENCNVTIVDNENPVAVCPATTPVVTLDANGNGILATNALGDGSSTDNCAAMETNLAVNFTCADIGTQTVVLTVSDGTNSDTENCDVTVVDTENPMAVCQDIDVQLDANNSATLAAAQIDGGSSDNCNVMLSIPPTTFDCDDVGTPQSVILTATDQSSNTHTCTATVTVLDDDNPCCAAPEAICQPYTAMLDATGNVTITENDVDNGSTFECGLQSMTIDLNTFDCSDVGTPQNVTLTVTDVNNDSDDCVAVVTVEDNVLPTPMCKDITIVLDANGNASITANDIDNGSADACGIQSLSASQTAFDCSDIGENMVALTVNDVNGNTNMCTAVVTVNDVTMPNAACENATVILDNSGNGSVTPMQIGVNSTDACGTTMLSLDISTFDCSNVGSPVTVTLTVTDASNNSSTCTASVTVEDQTPPTPICQPFTTMLDANGVATVEISDVLASASDNCGVQSGGQLSQTLFTCSEQGDNMVTVTVTDVNGLSANCQATVILQDNIAPEAMCQNITIPLDDNGNITIEAEDLDNGTMDNCSFTLSASQTVFDCSNLGDNTVILTANDGTNTTTCNSIVTIEDVTAPVANCQNIAINLDADGNATATATQINDGSTDACGITTLTLNKTDFTCEDLNENTVVLTVSDASGNSATCEATVTVVDAIPAIILCRPAVNTANDPGVCGAVVNPLPPLVLEENCSIENVTNDAPALFEIGTTLVTWTITDAGGNDTECLQNVTVMDTEAPVVECGQPFHAYLAEIDDDAPFNENNCHFPSYLLDPLMVISDNCDDTNLTITNDAPAFFTHGQYEVTYTFTDQNGNSSTCIQSVKVWDVTAPTLTSCPENIEVEATETDGADVFWSLPTAIDNCPSHDIILVEANGYQSGDFFEMGETAIQYNVYDENGQFTECNFTITVVPVGAMNLELFCMEELNISQQNAVSWSIFDWNPPLMATTCDQCDVLASDDFRFIGTLTGHQYYYQMADTMTFSEAQSFAENLETTIAILNNKKELPMVENELPMGNYFIGLIDEDGTNEFEWINGDEFDATEFGQTFENLTNEPAVVILNENGEWEVVDLDTEASFVFEKVCIDLEMNLEQNDDDDDEEMVEINTVAEVIYNAVDTCGNMTSCGFEITFTENDVDYCPQTGVATDSNQPFFLESFTLGNLTVESGNNNGYGDYTNKHFVFTENETVEMSAIFDGTAIDSVPMYYRIWIDYNADGDFFDENELAYQGIDKGTATGILTMPSLPQTVENTRMRMAISRLTFPESCGDYWNGETEDYSISIIVEEEDPIFGNDNSFGNKANNTMVVYPNPADDNFDIILKNEEIETATIRLFNRIGQRVMTQKIATNETVNLDIQDYPNGLYSLTAEVNGEIISIQKLVIEHK